MEESVSQRVKPEYRERSHWDEPGFNVPGNERLVRNEPLQKVDVGVRSDDLILRQSLSKDPESSSTRCRVHDKFRDQGVVEDLVPAKVRFRLRQGGKGERWNSR